MAMTTAYSAVRQEPGRASMAELLTEAWPSNGEHYREVAGKIRELAHQCHFPYARRELLDLARHHELRAEHIDSTLPTGSRPIVKRRKAR